MQSILVPVDFSDVTDLLVGAAEDLGARYQAKVWLMHCAGHQPGDEVGDIPSFVALPDEALPGRYPNEYRKLAALTESLRQKGIDAELVFVGGSPGKKIPALVESLPADFVIMGSHGRSGVSEFIMGSVARDVLKSATVPMLVIPVSLTLNPGAAS